MREEGYEFYRSDSVDPLKVFQNDITLIRDIIHFFKKR